MALANQPCSRALLLSAPPAPDLTSRKSYRCNQIRRPFHQALWIAKSLLLLPTHCLPSLQRTRPRRALPDRLPARARSSRAVPAPGVSTASPADSTALDDLLARFGQTEIDLERLQNDANSCRSNLHELREVGTQLAEQYAHLSLVVHQTEKRSELTADALTALEQRLGPLDLIRELTDSTDDRLASLGRVAEEVEHRAADFQAQKTLIDNGLVEATRVLGLLSALDARIATLTQQAQALAHAEETVGHLERRAAEATARLERRVDAFDTQKRSVEQALDNATRVTDLLSALNAQVATLKLPSLSESNPSVRPTSPHQQKAGRPAGRWVAIIGVLAAAVGIGMMGSLDRPTQLASLARVLRQDARLPDTVSPLPSTTLGVALTTLPADRPAAAISGMPATDASSDPPPATAPLRSPAVLAAAGGSGSAPSTRTPVTSGRLPDTSSPQSRVRQFLGDLVIESVPSGAAVFIDQKDAGRTPLQIRGVRAGSHVIRIENEGYERWTTTALVPADQRTRVNARLQPSCCPK